MICPLPQSGKEREGQKTLVVSLWLISLNQIDCNLISNSFHEYLATTFAEKPATDIILVWDTPLLFSFLFFFYPPNQIFYLHNQELLLVIIEYLLSWASSVTGTQKQRKTSLSSSNMYSNRLTSKCCHLILISIFLCFPNQFHLPTLHCFCPPISVCTVCACV